MKQFPKEFLIGAATAAHQVEGDNVYNDIYAQEQMKHGGYPEKSGKAADQYHRYKEDIQLMKKAGLNAFRFSLEWSRIEPENGKFNADAIQHYKDEILCCKENGIEPVVTLFHFTSPVWLIKEGGWESEKVITYFARYVQYVCDQLGDLLHIVCTINEANIGKLIGIYMQEAMQAEAGKHQDGLQIGMDLAAMKEEESLRKKESLEVFGTKDPQFFVGPRTDAGDEIVMRAHQAAMAVIRKTCPHVVAGLSLSVRDVLAVDGGEAIAAKDWKMEYLHYLPYLKDDDYLGIQNYTKAVFNANGQVPVREDEEKTQMGYAYYPEGLAHVLKIVHQTWHKDILVTESGIATDDDTRRCDFIRTVMDGLEECLNERIPVKGYLHWSLIDNYEWQSGYSMRFGLIGLNRETQERIVHPSLALLGSYAGK